jgi:hypothetical protein
VSASVEDEDIAGGWLLTVQVAVPCPQVLARGRRHCILQSLAGRANPGGVTGAHIAAADAIEGAVEVGGACAGRRRVLGRWWMVEGVQRERGRGGGRGRGEPVRRVGKCAEQRWISAQAANAQD